MGTPKSFLEYCLKGFDLDLTKYGGSRVLW